MKFTVCNIEKEFGPVSEYLKKEISSGKHIILLRGNLGAGKTTFVKHFIDYCGGNKEDVDSPTFSIVNTYKVTGKNMHHFDLYRLNSPEEVEDIGFMEYADSKELCFVEWPEKIAEYLPEEEVIYLDINISLKQCREYVFS